MSDSSSNNAGTQTPPSIIPAVNTVVEAPRPVVANDDNLACQWDKCTERCESPEALYDHICERHVGRKSTNNLNLTCGWALCRTTTVKRDHITSHIRVHVPLKPHKCDFCGKSFKRPQDLKKHVKTHADDSVIRSPDMNGGQMNGYRTGGKPTAGGYYDHSNQMHTGSAYGAVHGGHAGYYQPQPQNFQTPVYYQPVSHHQDIGQQASFDSRKRGFETLNEFFGDAKRRSIDPSSYSQIGSRLNALHGLPIQNGSFMDYIPHQQSMAGLGGHVGTATMSQPHYALPMPNLRTKSDLISVEHFLDQMQNTVYESPNHAAAAGIHLPGAHYSHQGIGFRQSHSPPQTAANLMGSHMTSQGTSMPPILSHSSSHSPQSVPALTPPSSSLSYTSGNSPVSMPGLSPTTSSRNNSASYPVLPAVSGIYSPHSNTAPVSTLGTAFDNDQRKRFSGGMLQRAAPTSAPRPEEVVDTREATKAVQTSPRLAKETSPSAIDPALQGSTVGSPTSDSAEAARDRAEEEWVENIRLIEALRKIVKDRLANEEYDEDAEQDYEGDIEMGQSPSRKGSVAEEKKEEANLYPVLRASDDN